MNKTNYYVKKRIIWIRNEEIIQNVPYRDKNALKKVQVGKMEAGVRMAIVRKSCKDEQEGILEDNTENGNEIIQHYSNSENF